jgi:hypothetical protein
MVLTENGSTRHSLQLAGRASLSNDWPNRLLLRQQNSGTERRPASAMLLGRSDGALHRTVTANHFGSLPPAETMQLSVLWSTALYVKRNIERLCSLPDYVELVRAEHPKAHDHCVATLSQLT